MPRLSVRHRIQTSSRISSEKSRRIKTVQMFKVGKRNDSQIQPVLVRRALTEDSSASSDSIQSKYSENIEPICERKSTTDFVELRFSVLRCDYACVNLSMLRSHKKSHYRHLLFKCADCSFESKDFSTIEEHLQIEGHQLHRDFQVDEFLQEHFSSILPKRNKKSIVEQETNRTLQCQFCDFQTESTDFFQIHLVQHTFDQWIEFFQGQKFNLEQVRLKIETRPKFSFLF